MHSNPTTPTRRSMLRGLLASLGLVSLTPAELLAAPKQPGETRVILLMGDYWHNPITQEKNWRHILAHAGWRLMFAQAPQFITPEVLEKADLLVISRYAKVNNLGWSSDRFVEDRPPEISVWTDERVSAIVKNVRRGMGLLSIHASVWNSDTKPYMDLVGVETPYMHTPVQPAYLHQLNPDHPITRDIEPQMLGDDEIFMADLVPGACEVLFNLKGEEKTPTDRAGSWCRTEGAGRVVTLLPGHTPHPYHTKSYKEIMWRSAHWAMHREIPSFAFTDGRPPEQ